MMIAHDIGAVARLCKTTLCEIQLWFSKSLLSCASGAMVIQTQ